MSVVHCRKSPFDVYIGRPSKWGNPFTMKSEADRGHVILEYEVWILQQPELMAALHELKGKVLGCWCSPRPCHGEVLERLAAQMGTEEERGNGN